MNSVAPAIGSLCLGIVIGWLVRYFIKRFKSFSPSVLSSVISIIGGATATRLLASDSTVVWYYPMGLLIGFIAYTVTVLWIIKMKIRTSNHSASFSRLTLTPTQNNTAEPDLRHPAQRAVDIATEHALERQRRGLDLSQEFEGMAKYERPNNRDDVFGG